MGKLHINLLGTSFTVQANEDSEYLEKLLGYYKRIADEVSGLESLKNPLQVSILAGIMVCDELYKLMDKLEKIENNTQVPQADNYEIQGDMNIMQAQEQAEAEKRTLDMIKKITDVLDTPENPHQDNNQAGQ